MDLCKIYSSTPYYKVCDALHRLVTQNAHAPLP